MVKDWLVCVVKVALSCVVGAVICVVVPVWWLCMLTVTLVLGAVALGVGLTWLLLRDIPDDDCDGPFGWIR